jgi:hypothetical protein
LGIAAWSVALAGCGSDETSTPSSSALATATPAATTSTPVLNVTMRIGVGPRPSATTVTISRHQSVYIETQLGPGIDPNEVTFVFPRDKGAPVPSDVHVEESEEAPVVPGTRLFTNKISTATGWHPGTYSAASTLRGTVVASVEFTVP